MCTPGKLSKQTAHYGADKITSSSRVAERHRINEAQNKLERAKSLELWTQTQIIPVLSVTRCMPRYKPRYKPRYRSRYRPRYRPRYRSRCRPRRRPRMHGVIIS
jgi:hypothetical protein